MLRDLERLKFRLVRVYEGFMAKGEWARTTQIITEAAEILEAEYPMTLRQCFYRLVSRGVIENTRRDYQSLSTILTKARNDGRVDFEWIVDRSRPAYAPSVFEDPAEYAETIKRAYRKDYWHTQPNYVEIWTEKDSITGSIEPVTNELGVMVRIGRGFLSTTRAHDIAEHFLSIDKPKHVFYLGDFDPSGVEIEKDAAARVLEQMSKELGGWVREEEGFSTKRLAIHRQDIAKFNLPPLRVKDTDSRSGKFRRTHGTEAVELDALPVEELRSRIRGAVSKLVDWNTWNRARVAEEAELASIRDFAARWSNLPTVGGAV